MTRAREHVRTDPSLRPTSDVTPHAHRNNAPRISGNTRASPATGAVRRPSSGTGTGVAVARTTTFARTASSALTAARARWRTAERPGAADYLTRPRGPRVLRAQGAGVQAARQAAGAHGQVGEESQAERPVSGRVRPESEEVQVLRRSERADRLAGERRLLSHRWVTCSYESRTTHTVGFTYGIDTAKVVRWNHPFIVCQRM